MSRRAVIQVIDHLIKNVLRAAYWPALDNLLHCSKSQKHEFIDENKVELCLKFGCPSHYKTVHLTIGKAFDISFCSLNISVVKSRVQPFKMTSNFRVQPFKILIFWYNVKYVCLYVLLVVMRTYSGPQKQLESESTNFYEKLSLENICKCFKKPTTLRFS